MSKLVTRNLISSNASTEVQSLIFKRQNIDPEALQDAQRQRCSQYPHQPGNEE